MKELPLYRIVDYNRYFENAKSRSVAKPQFVCVPNKHGGTGLCAVQGEDDGAAIYGIWMWMLQLCSRQNPPREGWLTADGKKNGRRLSARELSNLFRRDIQEIHRCLQVIQREDVGFIELIAGEPEQDTGVLSKAMEPIPQYSEPDTAVSQPDTGVFRTESLNEGRNEGKKERTLAEPDLPILNGQQPGSVSSADTQVSGHDTTVSAQDLIQHAEAKALIGDLALAAFDRKVREADWSNPEKYHWLDDALPLTRGEWFAVNWLYRLPATADALKRTARVQSFEAFLEHLKREIDKAKSIRKQLGLNGAHPARAVDDDVPAEWVESARELYGAIQLPKRRSQVPGSAQAEIKAHIAGKGGGK